MLRWWLFPLLVLLALPLAAQPYTLALFGDTPYSRWEREQLPAMLADMAQQGAAFAVHAGDIKGGGEVCSDAVYEDILGVFQAAPLPLVYVPGDNEWTDCHRRSNGGHDPLERLGRLRELFFKGEQSLGRRTLRLERQSRDPAWAAYRENVRWEQGGVLFIGLNVPGSHNNYHGASGHGGPVPEFLARSAANRAWLAQAFVLARQRKLAGLMIVIQGNPGFEAASAGQPRPGYRDLIEQLQLETQAYTGQVVLVHGDTHSYQLNQPLLDPTGRQALENFTRLEVHGYPFMGWVRVTVDRSRPRVFSFSSQRWTPQPPGTPP
jgi:hypothetical protein